MLQINNSFFRLIDNLMIYDRMSKVKHLKWVSAGFNDSQSCYAYLESFFSNTDRNTATKESLDLISVNIDRISVIDEKLISSVNLILIENIPDIGKHDIIINFFIGFGTCSAFPFISAEGKSINIALEKLIEKSDIIESVYDLIVHEVIHILRMSDGLYDVHNIGDLVVEEGIACYCHKRILKLNDSDDYRLFPIAWTDNDEDDSEHAYENLVALFDSSDFRIVYYGNKTISAGISYLVGYKLILDYMRDKNLNLCYLIKKLESKKILDEIRRKIDDNS